MIVLGINGINDLFHDASATLVVDGQIVASVEEERFNRRKHSNGIPFEAIRFCLKKAGIAFTDIDHIGYYLDPSVLKQTFVDDVVTRYGCPPDRIQYYGDAAARIAAVNSKLAEAFPFAAKTRFHFLNHHLAHAASAYYLSGFSEAAVLTIDGSGDRETSTLYYGQGADLKKVRDFLIYPESLGYVYTVFANHLALGWIEGAGKLMGLAGFGKADTTLLEDIIQLHPDPARPVTIDMSFFDYHIGGSGFSEKGQARFGAPRTQDQPLSAVHFGLAASVQAMLEKAILHILAVVKQELPHTKNLCFSGGVALNVCANRRILDSAQFDGFFVPPAAYDGGTSLGCALHLNTLYTGQSDYTFDPYTGPHITEEYDVKTALCQFVDEIRWEQMSEALLCEKAAGYIAENKIIAWAQGRMESGPRALGNRSILTNAANPDAKMALNTRVKKREEFRPYASSVLEEEADKWFDIARSPHMLLEAHVLEEKQRLIPGVVHVDGTSRPQTVTRAANPRYYRLIQTFHALTGIPMVLNTSFNKHGEPIVNTPEEAIKVLLETDLDALFLGNYHITRR